MTCATAREMPAVGLTRAQTIWCAEHIPGYTANRIAIGQWRTRTMLARHKARHADIGDAGFRESYPCHRF